jgi:ABC-type sugar transport system substrate-binding protein
VSPQNALVGADGVTRLLDFGVAKAVGRLQSTRDGQLKGKLAYMAPEQVNGDPVTRRTDVYSAAVILWETLTSQRLFEGENEANVLSKILLGEVPPPSAARADIPRSLDRVVLRGLDRDPVRRYASAREMAAHVEACLGVASPSEIADWLERMAGDELHERAERIEAMQRAGAVLPSAPPRDLAVERGSDDLPTVVGGSGSARGRRSLRLGLFLRAIDNEYQHLQREECLRVARRYGFTVSEAIGHNDADVQRRQIEQALADPEAVRPHVLLVNPVDETTLRAAALRAAQARVGWVSLNRNVEYLDELRLDHPDVPLFSVTPDQRQVGRIQGRQLRILLPEGGDVLYVAGPPATSSARLRRAGTEDAIAGTSIRLIVESSDWTVEGGAQVGARWQNGTPRDLRTPVRAPGCIICAQNDGMATGARSGWLERGSAGAFPLSAWAIGCDGTPSYGRRLVDEGQLVATVIIPPTTGRAVEEIALSLDRSAAPPAAVTISVESCPPIAALERHVAELDDGR